MDIDDVQSKFGNKYDHKIEQMKKYTDQLRDFEQEQDMQQWAEQNQQGMYE